MKEKDIAKATRTNAVLLGARCLALWVDPIEKKYAASEGVAIRAQEVVAIGVKGMRRRVAPVKSWGWAVTLPVTKKTGVVIFVPKSKRACRSVRLLPVSKPLLRSLVRPRRWAIYARS